MSIATPAIKVEKQITRLQGGSRNVFLGRQAIYDAHRSIHGYELLYRRDETEEANVVDGNRATAQVLLTR